MTANLFRLLRMRPIAGRAFLPEDDRPGAPQVAVLAHGRWMRRYGGDPRILGATGVATLAGRDFEWRDGPGSPPVAIVNQSFARREWPGESPLGKRIRFTGPDKTAWLTGIGVAPDMYVRGTTSETQEGLLLPLGQQNVEYQSIAVRAATNPLALTPAVRQQVGALDKDLPIYSIKTDVLLLTLRQGMRPVTIGIAAGLLLAAAVARLLALAGMQVHYLMFVGVALAVATVGGCACLAPALRVRAARVGPLVALRSE